MNKEEFMQTMGLLHGLDEETLVDVIVPQALKSVSDEMLSRFAFAIFVEQSDRYAAEQVADAQTSGVDLPSRYEDIRGE